MIPIHERFHTFQGEGVHVGRAAFFIRTFGCPVHCPWCDSAGTWHPDYVPKHISRMRVEDLVAEVEAARPAFVVITGGEPAVHDLHPLTVQLRAIHMPVHLETSGAFALRGHFDWITLSPKRWAPPLPMNVSRAHEFKIIVDQPGSITEYMGMLQQRGYNNQPVWLHPEWSKRTDPATLNVITETVKTYPKTYRAGWQLHKCYQADFRDNRSVAPVPLGGDPTKGF